ncbi:MAG TPA: ABC transporter substrate-binding protein [Candidatus Binatia bacterium]
MKNRKYMSYLFFAFALFVAATGSAQERTDKIYVGVAGLSGPLAHAFIPKDSGLYEKYGLNVELVFFQGGTQLIQATLAGSVKFAVAGGPEIVNARTSGSDLSMIMGYMNTLPYSIVSAKNITSFAQLKGGKTAISKFGSTSDLAMRFALEKNNLAPNRDVTILQLGDQTTRFAALTAGAVQATLISPPFDITAKRLGYHILTEMVDLGLPYQHEMVATSDRFIKEHPDVVRKYIQGFIAGIHLWMTDEKKTKQILARRLRINDDEILDQTYRAYAKLTEKKPYPTLAGIQFQLDDVAKRNPKAKVMKPEDFVNTTILRELDRSGFIDDLYKKSPAS